MKRWVRCVLFLIVVLGPQSIWARFMPPVCKNSFTQEQEITEGRKAAAQVYTQMPVLQDTDPVAVYVRQLGAKLTAQAPGFKWPYNFHVVNSAEINAFALPGGSIFVNLGTIQAATNEAQLAGVMAHEISHVVMRHSTCNMTKQQKRSVLFGIGQIASSVMLGGALGDVASSGIGFGAQTLFLSYSRDAEKQADLLGTDILYDAGYDPRALPQFFETIEGRYGKGGTQFLSDHPNPGNRTVYVNAEIATLPARAENVKNTPEFASISAEAQAMHALTAAEVKTGAWKTSKAYEKGPLDSPGQGNQSGPWQVLNDTGYYVQYPPDWTSFDGPGEGTVTIAPQNSVSSGDGSTTITRGMLTSSLPSDPGLDVTTSAGMDAAAAAVIKKLDRQTSSEVGAVTLNGQIARSVDLTGASPATVRGVPQIEHDWLVVFGAKDGSVRYVLFIAPEPEYAGLKPTFDRMLDSFKVK